MTWNGALERSAAFQGTALPMNADDAPPAGGITAIAPWFGGKRGLASRIVSELGQHRSYLELFCGGLSVVMRKPQASYETVNDLHGDLTHLARCLQDEATAMWLYHQAARTLFAEEILSAASSLLAGAPPPEMDDPVDRHRGLAFLVQSWMMRNGVAGTNIGSPRGVGTNIAVRYSASGGSPTVRWASMVESIPTWHLRLRSLIILRRDAFEILSKQNDEEGLAIYVDPPYLPEGRSGYQADGAQSRYLHEFEATGPGIFGDVDDHARLAEMLGRFKKARVVASYYRHPRLSDLYPGWTLVDCTQNKNMSNGSKQAGSGRTESPEVLLVNGPSLSGGDA